MPDRLALLMFVRGRRPGPRWMEEMDAILLAAARDTLDRAVGLFDRLIVATPDRAWGESLRDLDVDVDLDPADTPFHFGARLAEIVVRHRLDSVLYTGAASAPLLTRADLASIAQAARASDSVIIANNIHSTDWAVIAPANAVVRVADRLQVDSALGWVVSREAGLLARVWPRSPTSLLDIDTPLDALIAVRCSGAGRKLRAAVVASKWESHRLDAVEQVLAMPDRRLTLIGRVPSWSLSLLEQKAQLWVRVFSEERGMRASGRAAAGGVRSFVANYLGAAGPQHFFADLAAMTDAVLFDTRVVWAARNFWPDEPDRFASDLMMVDEIGESSLREFTRAAEQCPIPVLLGGHSLVSAGLWALLENAIAGHG